MDNSIVNCISRIQDFNKQDYIKFGIGLEIQDFINPNLLEQGWEERLNEYKKKLDEFPNIISLHGPFLDLNPASFDKKIGQVSYDRYLLTLNIGKELNADYIIFHSQINPWIKNSRMNDIINKRNKNFWEKILKETKEYKGKVIIENIFEDDPILIKELVDTIDSPNVKVCLDIGHAILKDNSSLANWIKVLNEQIEYIHLHWNNKVYDEHNKPSKKNLLLVKELLYKYKLEPVIALEYNINNLDEEIKRIRKI